MPRPHPPEFRARAIELARERAMPIAALAHDLGISESCLALLGWPRPMSTRAAWTGSLRPSAPSWWTCAASCGSQRWRTRSSDVRRPISLGRTSSQNDVHLHCPALLRPAGGAVLSGHGGVDIGVQCLAGQSGVRSGLRRRRAHQHHVDIHQMSRRSYGSPRVHAELQAGR